MPSKPPRFVPPWMAPAAPRPSAAKRGYGRAWQQARAAFLAANPWCRACAAAGREVRATHVDHVVPHRGDRQRFWNRTNWQPLCTSHHSAKTATEDGGFGNRRRRGRGV